MGSKRCEARFFSILNIPRNLICFLFCFEDGQSGISFSFCHEGPCASNKKRSLDMEKKLGEHCSVYSTDILGLQRLKASLHRQAAPLLLTLCCWDDQAL